ncbi:CinA family protein [Candidatus Bipolaricaulota bacterium]|nr:CinA family protein [Candidatus Bipolaricaulota bacterium]TFH07349.1 MAG: CinA family protein [Candidatus Atribacteria bacterium]
MNLGEHIADGCTRRKLTLATAESCTGGGLSHVLTAIPGASAFFIGGVIAYQNEVKIQWLGVPREIIQNQGAVSSPTARAMAEGCRDRFNSDFAVSITGIAGPGGGSEEKPVGTVHIAVAAQERTRSMAYRFSGDRETVRDSAIAAALELLLEAMNDQT